MTNLAQSLIPALKGQELGPYRLIDCIGAGGFGLVFHACNVATGAEVAIKVLMPTQDLQAAAEFAAEGELLEKLQKCDAVVRLVDSGTGQIDMATTAGVTVPLPLKYLVLNLASGALGELTQDPDRLDSLAWVDRLSLWRGAVKGVHQMHLKSVAHRDIKAENCLLLVSGNRTELRIADLGRSKDFSLPPTLLPRDYLRGRGDLRFAPPEYLFFQGGYTEASFRAADVYGLGSLLAELVTGHPMTALALGPFPVAVAQGENDFRSGVSRELSNLRPRFRQAISEVVDEVPSSIRSEAKVLLTQICDPVPDSRFPQRRLKGKHVPDPGLLWLIQKADILTKRMSVENSKARRAKKSERSIS